MKPGGHLRFATSIPKVFYDCDELSDPSCPTVFVTSTNDRLALLPFVGTQEQCWKHIRICNPLCNLLVGR